MSKIDQTFESLKRKRASALIPFIMAGDPDIETTEALIFTLAEAGADIIELGVPFSDPLADGPVIQAASRRALQNGINLHDIFLLREKVKEVATPLVLMTYFNPVLRFGLKDFAEGCKQSQMDGVIIPDLPPEEAGLWLKEAREKDVDTIFLISPTSPLERVRLIGRYSQGYIYYVSLTGVTGTRETLSRDLESAVRWAKEQTRKPVAVGFGISTPDHVKEVSGFADGVIVGSAIEKIIEENLENQNLVDRVGSFVFSLAKALKDRT